jgi:hypothetical protein
MDTVIVKKKNGKKYNQYGQRVILCKICKINHTTLLATQKCDECWELENRVLSNPKLAIKILKNNGKL